MPFSSFKLDPALLRAVRELGFVRPTPIQAEAIPPAVAGRDVLACAMTGSGKTAAFLLPIIHALIDRPRRTTRALVLTPTRELAAQILEDLNALAVHTPVTGAAVYGGVSMGPQEHAFRSGVDVIVATPGRLLDHFRAPYAKLQGIEHLGIQVESSEELTEVYGRLKSADRPVLEEGATTCCYAKSEKSWIADPDGVVWETFLTNGDATLYGDSPALDAASLNASNDTCCAPSLREAPAAPALDRLSPPGTKPLPAPATPTADNRRAET